MLKISMKRCLVFILPTICLLQGCQSTNQPKTEQQEELVQTAIKPTQELFTPTPGLSLQKRFSKALRDLENGREGQALAELEEYNREKPNFARVESLINQIKTPSNSYFTEDYFTINLASGQSLSTLAKRYLGSAFEFYALAKYNGIKAPSKVLIGQEIKIPETQLAKSVRNAELQKQIATKNIESETNTNEVIAPQLSEEDLIEEGGQNINELISDEEIAKEVEGALQEDSELVEEVSDPQTLVSKLTDFVLIKDFESADVLATDSLDMNPSLMDDLSFYTILAEIKEGRANQLVEVNPEKASNLLLESLDLRSDSLSELDMFFAQRRALSLNEDNIELADIVSEKKENLAESYHRTASTAYQKQDLETAIENWKTVLKIDPNHQQANVFLTNAENLKKRLDKLQD